MVQCSSVASDVGNAGQANYAAANGALDALSCARARNGMPSVSIRWGPWSSAGGMFNDKAARQAAQVGVVPLDPSTAVLALKMLLV